MKYPPYKLRSTDPGDRRRRYCPVEKDTLISGIVNSPPINSRSTFALLRRCPWSMALGPPVSHRWDKGVGHLKGDPNPASQN